MDMDAPARTVQKTVMRAVALLLAGLALLGAVIGLAIHLLLRAREPAPSACAEAELRICCVRPDGGEPGGGAESAPDEGGPHILRRTQAGPGTCACYGSDGISGTGGTEHGPDPRI